MLYQGFCGPSNQSQSLLADTERLVNFYTEAIQSRYAPVSSALYPTPGRRTFATTTDVGGGDIFTAAGRAFAVIGLNLYEVYGTGLTNLIGAVARDNNPAQMAYNSASGGQLVVASGTNAYHYNLTTAVFQQVLTAECTMIGSIDGRFLAFNIVTGQVRLSDLNDGTSWSAQSFARSAASDRWQAMVIGNREICMLGEETTEFWYNSGATPQPFALNPGSLFQVGTRAPWSARRVGDAIVWLSGSTNGQGRPMRARGYAAEPIGNYAVETAIATYARTGTIADCEVLSYEQEGHQFAVFSFPQFGSWAVDVDTGAWHEIGPYDSANFRYGVWGPRAHCVAFNKHLVVDRTTGIVSELDVTIPDDLGVAIRRLRIGPPLYASSRQRMVVSRLDLLFEPGLGLVSGQGSAPAVMLRTSTNAKTWSTERQMSAGALGQYDARVYATMLGSSEKIWVPEITVTDPILWRCMGAEIDGSGFAQQRAA